MNLSVREKNICFVVVALCILVTGIFIVKMHDQSDEAQTNNLKDRETKNTFPTPEYLSSVSPKNPLEHMKIDTLRQESDFSEQIYTNDTTEPIRTNQWFSSLYFSDTSEVLFAYPLAVKFTKKGFQAGYPNIHKIPNAIFGSFTPDVVIELHEKVSASLLSSSDLSVQVLLRSDATNRDVATVTITRGSPYIFVETKEDHRAVTIKTKEVVRNDDEEVFSSVAPMQATYGLYFDTGKFELSHEEESHEIRAESLCEDALFTIGIAPKDMQLSLLKQYAFDPIEDTQVGFSIDDRQYVNTFSYLTRARKETILALFSWQSELIDKNGQFGKPLNTIRGQQELYVGNNARFFLPMIFPEGQLSVKEFSEQRKNILMELVHKDTFDFEGFRGGDTYFHGKELLRVAQLYDLAMQLELVDESDILHDMLRAELERWKLQSMDMKHVYADHYLTYDQQIKGIVGHNPSFGSEKFNDHHFHYGYFIHAAAILGRYDAPYVEQNKRFINLFVKDFINYNRNDKKFAFLRNFDLYEGHSWASGTVPFADGNNQESSSEAIHSYYGAYIWAKIVGNEELEKISLWLYNSEIDSANRYWFVLNDKDPLYDSYEHSLVSLLWGGKVEWATWFSPDAEAKLGIQLLPMHAGSDYLAFDPEEVRTYLAETSFPQQGLFFDYLTMFSAYDNPVQAEKLFHNMKDGDIDGGNSRSFIYAWISQRAIDNKEYKQ